MEKANEKSLTVKLSEQEWQVIQLMRQIDYGELMISMKGSKPCRVEEIRKSIQIK